MIPLSPQMAAELSHLLWDMGWRKNTASHRPRHLCQLFRRSSGMCDQQSISDVLETAMAYQEAWSADERHRDRELAKATDALKAAARSLRYSSNCSDSG